MDTNIVLAWYGWISPSPRLTSLVVVLAQWGIVVIPLALAVLWLMPGPGIPGRREAVILSAISALFAAIILLVLDQIVDRPRPFVALHLVPLFPHDGDSSFPSDHTLASVALAGPLVARRPMLGVGLVILSLAIGAARVAAGVHYPSDVLGSSAIAAWTSGLTLLVRPVVPSLAWLDRSSRSRA